ncbi:MAG: hypothetical protein ACREGC_03200, partial [Minisyncoccia bacterium]
MMHLKRIILILFCLSTITAQAVQQSTGPTIHSRCRMPTETPPNGTGVLFDESCTTAYVKPPLEGRAEVKSLARTTNLQFCPAVKSVERVAEQAIKAMAILMGKIEQMVLSFEPLEKDLVDLKLEVVTAKAKMEVAKKRLDEAQGQMDLLSQAISQARQDYRECVDDLSAGDSSCVELKQSWEQAKQNVREFRRGDFGKQQENVMDKTEDHNILAARLSVRENRYQEAIEPMLDLQARINKLNGNVIDLYNDYGRMEGATGKITWSIHWGQLLQDYQRLNQNLQVNWVQLPIKEAEFSATVHIPGSSEGLVSVSAV